MHLLFCHKFIFYKIDAIISVPTTRMQTDNGKKEEVCQNSAMLTAEDGWTSSICILCKSQKDVYRVLIFQPFFVLLFFLFY